MINSILVLYFSTVFIILFAAYCNADPKHISEIVDLRAVTYHAEFEDLYEHLFANAMEIPLQEPTNPRLRMRIKRKLCKRIFRSTFYNMNQEDWFDVETPANRALFMDLFPHIFERVFKTTELPQFKCWGDIGTSYSCWHDDYVYENDYKIKPVYLARATFSDYFFSCFTKDRQTGGIREYFVSREYNIVENMLHSPPMAGRFILAEDEDDELSLNALAEESAIGSKLVTKTSIAELYYVKFRADTFPSKTAEDDPLCSLPIDHKLRLCASIFASPVFKNRVKFLPAQSNVETYCVRKRVSFFANISKRRRFLLKITRKKLKKDREYDEWMVNCRVWDVAKQKMTLYYVSRGDLQHTVFLYSRPFQDERVYVDNYLTNVTVADVDEDSIRSGPLAATGDDEIVSDDSGSGTGDEEPELERLFGKQPPSRPFLDERVYVDNHSKNVTPADVDKRSRRPGTLSARHDDESTSDDSGSGIEDDEPERRRLFEKPASSPIFKIKNNGDPF